MSRRIFQAGKFFPDTLNSQLNFGEKARVSGNIYSITRRLQPLSLSPAAARLRLFSAFLMREV